MSTSSVWALWGPGGNALSVLFPPLLHPVLRAEVHLMVLPMALAMAICLSPVLHSLCEGPLLHCHCSSFDGVCQAHRHCPSPGGVDSCMAGVLSHILGPLLSTSRYHPNDPIWSILGKLGQQCEQRQERLWPKPGKMLSS